MFKEAFEKLDLAEVATLLDRLNPLMQGTNFDPLETTITAVKTSFYQGCRLLDIADYTAMPATRRYAVVGPKKAMILNFTNDPIYALNQDIPLKLNENSIADYVRFVFGFVRGRHGRFIIAENIDDIHWKEDPPPQARKAIGKMVVPVTLLNHEEGVWRLQATMMFKDSLFKSDVTVQDNGVVSLQNEELLIEDMPVLDDTFGQ